MPNVAFLLILSGVALIYCEFVLPGRIVFGAAGALSALCGLALLLRVPHPSAPIILLLIAACCFAMDAFIQTWFLACIAGTLLLAYAFSHLGVTPLLAYTATPLFGLGTAALNSVARRARRNKQSDL